MASPRSGIEISLAGAMSEAVVRAQLDLLAGDSIFRTSKRSVAFLRYVVEQTLEGGGDQLKERTIGIEVFGRDPAYDTSGDHVVRTAATELRKRLAIYYGQEQHRTEMRISMLPGSYIPQFAPAPEHDEPLRPQVEEPHLVGPGVEPSIGVSTASLPQAAAGPRRLLWFAAAAAVVVAVTVTTTALLTRESPRTRFWNPVLHSSAPVLIAVGDVPHGPPVVSPADAADAPPSPEPSEMNPPAVPFEDAVTIARISSVLSANGRQVVIRRENASSFSDLRAGPAVLVGAFNNEWSLRLARPLRFSLAMDASRRLIYIRDRDHPELRQWSWDTGEHAANPNKVSSTPEHDFALVSRLANSETGQVVVMVGGLYAYGTQAAGEFLADPQLMSLAKGIPLDDTRKNLQIVLETDVTQGVPGPPRVLAFSSN